MILAARLMTPEELNALRPSTPRCVVIEFPTEGTVLNFVVSLNNRLAKYEAFCDATLKSHRREARNFDLRMSCWSNWVRSAYGSKRHNGRKPRRDH